MKKENILNSRQNHSKNKLVREDVPRVLARSTLWVPAYVGFERNHRNITMFI